MAARPNRKPIPPIRQTVTIDDSPPLRDTPAAPGTSTDLVVNARYEYVSGGSLTWYRNAARTLPWAIDDVTHDLGDDLYNRMLSDSQVAACVNVMKASILEDGVHLLCVKEDEADDGYELAKEITDVATRMLEDLETDLDTVLWDMLDCVALGNRVAEEVYDLDTTTTGKQRLVLRKLKVKPRHSTAFVVDTYQNLLGLMALIPGQAVSISANNFITDATAPNLLPRDKFAIASFRPTNHDPRGTSILRPAYNAWWLKQQLWPEYLKYLAQFASPSLAGFTAPGALPTKDPTTGLMSSPAQVMTDALVKFANGTVSVFPHGATLQPINMQGNGEAFLAAITTFDHQITKAILTQSLATEEGKYQARAAAGVHQDILGVMMGQAKKAIERMLRRDILVQWVRYNWGDAAVELTPKVTLGETEKQDFPAIMAAVTAAGYTLAPSQYPYVDTMLSLPQREADEMPPTAEELAQQKIDAAKAAADAQAAHQPPPPDGTPPTDGQPPAATGDATTPNAPSVAGNPAPNGKGGAPGKATPAPPKGVPPGKRQPIGAAKGGA